MGTAVNKPFHLRQWLSVQQAVTHLSAVAEEPFTSADLADLAEQHQLDLYWYRPGQQVAYLDRPAVLELSHPLRLCAENPSDWKAIVGILRQRPALPAYEQDTPLLEDEDGNRLRISFDHRRRPEPFSGRWYPSLAELVVRRGDIEQLEPTLFSASEAEHALEKQQLLNVIWELEKLALDGEHHSTSWLAEQIARRSSALDRQSLERILTAAEREGSRGTPH
ncbi:hypothetical protein AWR36_006480 [Microbulbifer flavimaris]|uniref:Uncharacterized protein n=1 Tax=Microbulbifer flavimaris TaxID=1781068 RepID=A0ABX4I242_9GAMM|nr:MULTISPECIES: hypothetical protein [Microbulbifer]KUJ84003.1 hypothetical protein AVO43_06465 [Microbulbifer sp. ZGT114]PCO06171.1 hypothetical protein AWR36_006480 [Microbulbifer flavimaris]